MGARRTRCVQYDSRSCLRIEARNIGCNAAVEQLDILRQIADVTTERFRGPLLKRGIIDFDFSTKLRPNAHQRPRKRRLAGSTGTDDPEPLPAAQPERNIVKDQLLRARCGDMDLL